jgi:single-strand DNA-binding protein
LASLNRAIIVGRLLSNPESRATVEGVPLTRFKITVGSFNGQPTGSLDVVAWRRLAEICGQYLKTGRLVLVEGKLQVRSFDDKSGQRKWVTELIASNMQMLDGGAESLPHEVKVSAEEEVPEEVEELPEGDLPF